MRKNLHNGKNGIEEHIDEEDMSTEETNLWRDIYTKGHIYEHKYR